MTVAAGSEGGKLIGVVTADIANPFFSAITQVIEAEAQRLGYAVLIASTGESAERERTYLKLLRERGIDGLILTTSDERSLATLLEFRQAGLHSVLLDRILPGHDFDSVQLDNHAAGVAAVELAIAMGHRRIALIGGTSGLSVSDERVRGYGDALRGAGLPLDAALVADGRLTVDGGHEAARRLLVMADPPTAVVAASNLMMIGLMNCIVQMGLRCPSEVSVISIDDVPWAESFTPRLTAVAQPIRAMGVRAVQLLLERMTHGGHRPTAQRLFQPQLHMRDSVAPPPR